VSDSLARSGGHAAVSRALAIAQSLREEDDIINAEIVDYGPVPTNKALIARGRVLLADMGRNPDDWIDAATEEALRVNQAQNTLDVIHWGWGRWVWWAGLPQIGVSHEPPNIRPNAIRRYIEAHKTMAHPDGRLRGRRGRPYSPNVVELAVAVISMVYRRLGYLDSPTRHPKVREQLDAYWAWWTGQGYEIDQADPITPAESVIIARTQHLGTVGGLRNATAFRLLYDLGCRPAELLALQMADLRWRGEHRLTVTIRRWKSNREGKKPRHVGVQGDPAVDWDVDPERLARTWWEALQSAGHTSGPFFPEVNSSVPRLDGRLAGSITGEPWLYEALARAWNRAVKATDLALWTDPVSGRQRRISLYSNRTGLITALFDEQVPLEVVERRTGHSPGSASLRRYVRSGEQWDDQNPGLTVRRRQRPAGGG